MAARPRVENPYELIKPLNLARRRDRNELLALFLYPVEEATTAPLAVLEALFASGSCKSALVEHGYIDRDHARSYTRFYAQAFQDVSKRTIRVHFFGTRLTRSSLDLLDEEQFQKSYLGFSVLRPSPVRRVGRTVIHPVMPTLDIHFPLALASYDTSVCGTAFSIRGAPYQEQDARVASCASAALWMSAEAMAPRFRLPRFTTAEITDFATSHGAGERAIPSGGLRPPQIGEAFRAMGYDPVIRWIESRQDAMQQVYPYIESGLAPILLVNLVMGRHAVAGVGHTYDAAMRPRARVGVPWHGEQLRFWHSWQWVDKFLINDDQRGPYRTMQFIDRRTLIREITSIYGEGRLGLVRDWKCPVKIDMSFPLLSKAVPDATLWPEAEYGDLYGAVVPLPQGISLTAEEACEKAVGIIRMWYDILQRRMPSNLYLRSYLTRSAEFKRHMSAADDIHPFLRQLYRGKNLPQWIWVTEVGRKSELVKSSVDEQRIRGEILIDTNSSPWTPDFLALHMPLGNNRGHLTTMRADETSYDEVRRALSQGWLLLKDTPYKPLLR